jgi:hypothetical protein
VVDVVPLQRATGHAIDQDTGLLKGNDVSNHTAVLGKIEVPKFPAWETEWDAIGRLNDAAIASLPDVDTWPYLSRVMFAATPESQSYYHRVYHFAATMKGIEEEWHVWVEKFENLLRRMCWFSADVYLETEYFGNHSYWWVASDPKPGQVVLAWGRGDGPWSYAEFEQIHDRGRVAE